ncbi:MAG: S8 family peptidase [Ignavibacteriae bacterium]|nr:S8 family peptidase [Ignavibacteriota bacterium]
MKTSIIIFTILFTASLIAQEKYLIYFKDKGDVLSKFADKEKISNEILSEKSIERRKKNLGENYLTISDLPINENYIDKLEESNIKIINKLKWFNAVSAFLSNDELNRIKEFSFISKIEKVRKLKSLKPINDNSEKNNVLSKSNQTYTYDYGSSLTQNELSEIPAVHDFGFSGEGVIIGILDTGFDWQTVNSLKNKNVIAEHDFVFNDSLTANETDEDVSTQHNHGTSVFSILAGFEEGKIVGPAFNSSFILAKTEYVPSETHVEEDNYAAALEWMDSIGVDITTSSLGYSVFDKTDFSYTYEDMDGKTTIVTKAAELAFEKGITVITSAGNEGNSVGNDSTYWYYISAPGDGFNTLTIGAVTSSNTIASFSSRGPTYDGRIKPEVVAQGVSVFNANAGNESSYSFGNGTSYSAPIVAGIAGQLLSAFPHLSNKQIRSILIKSGDNQVSPNTSIGYGLVSSLKAILFPNLEMISDKYFINKIISDSFGIQTNTVEVISESGNKFSVNQKSGIYYQIELPSEISSTNNKIYFTYKDLQNNIIRDPKEGFYELYFDDLINDTTEEIPQSFKLLQNYPNPFNHGTIINYSLSNERFQNIQLKVYDILGREITTLVNENKSKGNFSVYFDSKKLASGIYFYTLRTSDFSETKKMMLLK